jgi:hypothetical protein
VHSYRFYFLNLRSAITSAAIILNAETDAAALLGAEALFRDEGASTNGFELWDRNRRIHRLFKA